MSYVVAVRGIVRCMIRIRAMVFNITFEKTTYLSQVTDEFITSCYIKYTLPWSGFELIVFVVIGTDYIGSCKSNYHTILTTTSLGMMYSKNRSVCHILDSAC